MRIAPVLAVLLISSTVVPAGAQSLPNLTGCPSFDATRPQVEAMLKESLQRIAQLEKLTPSELEADPSAMCPAANEQVLAMAMALKAVQACPNSPAQAREMIAASFVKTRNLRDAAGCH